MDAVNLGLGHCPACDNRPPRRHAGGGVMATAETQSRWRVVGTDRGKLQTRIIFAWDHNDAIRKASGPGYMLCVRDCVLID